MSNYVASAYHPKTGRIVDAHWIDNQFGTHVYGVKFDGDEHIYKSAECCIEAAAAEIERLRAALKPFADAVYNDNGDMTITPCGHKEYAKAYFVLRGVQQQPTRPDEK